MKSVIIFYSNTGHTRAIAERIRERIGCPLYEVAPAVPYGSFIAAVRRFGSESRGGVIAKYTAPDVDFTAFDTVFIGYPVWAGGVPPFFLSYLKKQDFTGKTVVPFAASYVTHIAHTLPRLKQAVRGADVKLPYNISLFRKDNIEDWLEKVSRL